MCCRLSTSAISNVTSQVDCCDASAWQPFKVSHAENWTTESGLGDEISSLSEVDDTASNLLAPLVRNDHENVFDSFLENSQPGINSTENDPDNTLMVASEQPHANLIPEDATLVMPITQKASKKDLLAPGEIKLSSTPRYMNDSLFKSSQEVPTGEKRTSRAITSLESAEKQLADCNQCVTEIIKILGKDERKDVLSVEHQPHSTANTNKENSHLIDELHSENERLKRENHRLRHDKQVLHTRLCKLELESRVESLKRELMDVKKALSTEKRKVRLMQEHVERLKGQISQTEEIVSELTRKTNAHDMEQDIPPVIKEREVEWIRKAVHKLERINIQMTYVITELSMTAYTYGSELSISDRKYS